MAKMEPKASLGIRATLVRKGNLEITAYQGSQDSEGSRDFPGLLGKEERRGTPGCQAPPGPSGGRGQRERGAPRGQRANKASGGQRGIRENQEIRDFRENLEIMERQDLKASGVLLARKEKRVEEECLEKSDLEDSQDQPDPRVGRGGKAPQAAPATLDLSGSRGSRGSLAMTGGQGGRDPLARPVTRGSQGPAALTGGGAGRGGQANLGAVDPLVPEAMWALRDRPETWASRALRESLDHLENKDSGEPWDQL